MTTDSGDLARDVLVHWALPLLARARRMADDPYRTTAETWELLADDIAALIGHGVTDQPPAPELAEVLAGADLPPVRQVPAGAPRLGTPEHFQAARNVARSAAPKKEQDPAGAAPIGGPGCDVTMPHCLPNRAGRIPPFDDAGHPPNCPAYRAPHLRGRKSRGSAPRTPLPEAFGPRPDRCPTCGARP